MIRWFFRRLSWLVFVVWATVTLSFAASQLLPNDPARLIAGAQARPEDVAKVRAQLGLDRPPLERYGRFLARLVHFGNGPAPEAHTTCGTIGPFHLDLGRSYQQRRPVTTILKERIPNSLALALLATFGQAGLGTAIGAFAARSRGRAADRISVGATLALTSMPTFVVGVILQYVFAYRLALLPIDGYGKTFGDHAASIVLPTLTLTLYGAAIYARLVRDETIGALDQDYVRTARAKGASRNRALVVHALRNALLPIVTIVGLDFGLLVGGAVVTEALFRWPGIGSLAASSLLDRDGPLMLGCVTVTATAVATASVIVDGLYRWLDPRTRSSG